MGGGQLHFVVVSDKGRESGVISFHLITKQRGSPLALADFQGISHLQHIQLLIKC